MAKVYGSSESECGIMGVGVSVRCCLCGRVHSQQTRTCGGGQTTSPKGACAKDNGAMGRAHTKIKEATQ